MKQLVNQVPLAETLTTPEKEIILAKNGQRIFLMTEQNVTNEITLLIGNTHFSCGQTFHAENNKLTIPMLIDDLMKYFNTLTISEIAYSFKLGIMGEFGDWFGLNNKTYLQWCKGFITSQSRLNANKKQMIFLAEINKPKEMTQDEKDKIIFDGVLIAFQDYKKNGFVHDMGNVSYTWLSNKNIISFTLPRKLAIVERAKEFVKKDLVDKLQYASRHSTGTDLQSVALKSKIIELRNEIEKLTNGSDKVRIEARRMALNDFFKDLVETGTELKELLNHLLKKP